ncbi:MAG: DNA translocase FtsK 4TM domain-containing protein [Alphaproteobacteria bacterium]|nr:DNA translocase FtsK 4TM domain-containing protein [Alphaproteobacteria bacterium]
MAQRPLVRARANRYRKNARWMPDAFRQALKSFWARLQGGAIIVFALLLAVALVSYSSGDVSFNTASPQNQNILGLIGSYTADFIWQHLGIAGTMFTIVLLAWGWLIGSQRGLDLFWGRTLAAFVAVLAAGTAIAALDPEASLGVSRFWGGAYGKLFANLLIGWLPAKWGGYMIAVVFAFLSISALYMACALTFEEWQSLGQWISQFARRIVHGFFSKAHHIYDAICHRRSREEDFYDDLDEDDEDDEDEEESASPPSRSSRTVQIQRAKNAPRQARFTLRSGEDHELPSLDLLQWPESARRASVEQSEEALEKNAKILESVLSDFGVYGQITKVSPGPVVTLYELEPSPGTRSSRVISLADDIARNMSAVSVRVAVVQGRNVIGIELPNKKREMVYLRELLLTESFTEAKGDLPIVLGKDIAGLPVIADLARMPHLLIAGTTGSGKSVAVNTMILSLLYRFPPQKCRFIMIDPKMLELSVYDNIPHLLTPVVTDSKTAITALKWTVREMEARYRDMSKLGVRNIEGYNTRLREAAKAKENLTRTILTCYDRETGKPVYEEQPLDLTPLPHIVVIVDEMADLMIVAGKDIEAAVQRLAQMARAAGIHLLMATQRPSVDVITGTIKANFPTRVSFQVSSKIDSRTILNEQGAEQLLGQGDMLYMAGGGRITRVHGPFVGDDEVKAVVKFLRTQGEPDYLDEITEGDENDNGSDFIGGMGDSGNELYDKAVDIVLRERKASTSFLQRHLGIGYNKAATLIERMEKEGLISESNHVGKREVYGRGSD